MALAQLRLGNVKGNTWYSGNKITGNKKEGTVFVGSEITRCFENDMYLNTDTSDIYKCTLGGNSATAKWAYVMSLSLDSGIVKSSESVVEEDYELLLDSLVIKGNLVHPVEPSPDMDVNTGFQTVSLKEIKVTGRNLFDINNISKSNLSYDSESNTLKTSDSVITYYISTESNTDYTISKSIGKYLRVLTSEKVSDGSVVNNTLVCENSENKLTINTGNNGNYLSFCIIGDDETELDVNEVLSTVMIEKGSDTHDYETYKESKITFNTAYGDVMVGINGVCDEILKRNGKWCLIRRFIVPQRFSSMIDLEVNSIDGDMVSFSFYANLGERKLNNNYAFRNFKVLKSKSQGETEEGAIFGDTEDDKYTVYAYLKKERFEVSNETNEEYKNAVSSWMSSNNFFVVYQRETEVITEYSSDSLRTFKGYSNIITNSFTQPVYEYDYPSSNLGVYSLVGYDVSNKLLKQSNVYKGVLKAGQTSIKIETNDVRDNSILSYFTSVYGLQPKTVSVTGFKYEKNLLGMLTMVKGSVTMTFDRQEVDVNVGFRIEGEW